MNEATERENVLARIYAEANSGKPASEAAEALVTWDRERWGDAGFTFNDALRLVIAARTRSLRRREAQ